MHNNLVRNQSPVILLKASKNTSVTFYFDVGPWWTVLRASSVLGYLLRSYQWTSVADSEDEITLSRSRALFGWRSLTSRELSTRTGVSSLVYCSLSALHWLRQDSAYTYTDIMVTYCCQLLPTAVTDSTQTLPSQALHRHCRHRLNKDTAVTGSTRTLGSMHWQRLFLLWFFPHENANVQKMSSCLVWNLTQLMPRHDPLSQLCPWG